MESLPLPHPSKQLLLSSTNFTKIPSWVSLKSNLSPPPSRNGNVENLHLISLAKLGNLHEAHDFLDQMHQSNVPISPNSFQHLFRACSRLKSLSHGKLFHEKLRSIDGIPKGALDKSVLEMFCECGSLVDARNMFGEMISKSSDSWGLIISAYARNGVLDESIQLFLEMQLSGLELTPFVYVSLMRVLKESSLLGFGMQLHSLVIRKGLASDASIGLAIENMYAKCGWLEGARSVFNGMVERNMVSWTALMVGYSQVEENEEVLQLFIGMVKEGVSLDEYVFSIVLKACSSLVALAFGKQIHCYTAKLGLESNVSTGTPLVDFYIKCGNMESARRAFERIHEPTDVSWSALIAGYCQSSKYEESIDIFKSLRSNGLLLNQFIYTNIFQACSAMADPNVGCQIHGDAIKRGLVSYLHGESALITMYSRCGRLDYAHQAFQLIDKPDTVAWTAMISAFSYHGHALDALNLFKRMQDCGIRPNIVTFVAVLTACSHSGLVTDAKQYLDSMSNVYGVEPTVDHYDCMVDVYSRAGLLGEALELIQNMPFQPDVMTWKTLLGGCSIHHNFELGKIAADNILELAPEDTSPYILMFNLYASIGKWEEASFYRKSMVERNLRKELSCSWINVQGKVHRFVVGDRHHPRTREIYAKLLELNCSAPRSENTHIAEDDLSHGLPERPRQLLDHSEKLAIAFGLISTAGNAPILVFKNLRACHNCHDFAKYVSLVTSREIIVRDSSRFHHFRLGKCSCNDFW